MNCSGVKIPFSFSLETEDLLYLKHKKPSTNKFPIIKKLVKLDTNIKDKGVG